MPTRTHLLKRTLSTIGGVALLAATLTVATGVAANADVPETPIAAPFQASECVGTTNSDPTQDPGVVADLTSVFGQRLTDFNAGKIVVLYDSWGGNDLAGYPPVCATRYVEGQGAVSEWTFCTDIKSHTCAGTDEEGSLLNENGEVIPGLEPQDSNPRLTNDQQKLIAYLIQNGHAYEGFGYYSWNGVTDATAVGSFDNRAALQTLIWCVSDVPDRASSEGSVIARADTCDASMDAAEQARLLALIPDEPSIELEFDAPTQALSPGDTASFDLTTNVYGQPIEIAATGVAGTLEVLSGAATLGDNAITITGTDPTVSTTVTLGFTSDVEGAVTLSAKATPASLTHIAWNQSAGLANGVPCQVFATFNEDRQLVVADDATVTFVETPTPEVPTPEVPTPEVPTPEVPTPEVPTPEVPTPEVPKPETPKPTTPVVSSVLANTGAAENSAGVLGTLAFATLGAGIALVLFRRGRVRH